MGSLLTSTESGRERSSGVSESPGEREEERGGERRGDKEGRGGERRGEEEREGATRREEIREASLKSLNIFSHLVDTSLLHNVAFVI